MMSVQPSENPSQGMEEDSKCFPDVNESKEEQEGEGEAEMEDEEDIKFASAENYRECREYLAQTLSMHGFPYDFDTDFSTTEDKVAACNCLYELIRDRQKLQLVREDLTTEVSRSKARCKDLSSTLEDVKVDLLKTQREHWLLKERFHLAEQEHRAAIKKLKLHIAKLNKENVMIKNRDKGYTHKLRKEEHVQVKLKDRLSQAQRTRSGSRGGPKIEIVSFLKPRTKWKKSSHEDTLLKETLAAYEKKTDRLSEENFALRKDLEGFRVSLNKILDKKIQHITISKPMEEALEEFNPSMIQMPYHYVQDIIRNGFNAKLIELQLQMKAIDDRCDNIKNKTAEELAFVVNEQRAMLRAAEALMRAHLLAESPKKSRSKQRSTLTMSTEKLLQEDRKYLEEKKDEYVKQLMEVDKLKRELEKELGEANEKRMKSQSSTIVSQPKQNKLLPYLSDDFVDENMVEENVKNASHGTNLPLKKKPSPLSRTDAVFDRIRSYEEVLSDL